MMSLQSIRPSTDRRPWFINSIYFARLIHMPGAMQTVTPHQYLPAIVLIVMENSPISSRRQNASIQPRLWQVYFTLKKQKEVKRSADRRADVHLFRKNVQKMLTRL